MKRDLELVRAILLALEAADHGFAPHPFTVPGYDADTIGHHVWLMQQGGLLTASTVVAMHDASPIAIPESITWQGHEFLAAVRNDTVWRKVKADVKDKGLAVPFSVIQTLALKIIEKLAGL
jgi:hypothetical protein